MNSPWVRPMLDGARALGLDSHAPEVAKLLEDGAVLAALERQGKQAALATLAALGLRRADKARLAWLRYGATFGERLAASDQLTDEIKKARRQQLADFELLQRRAWALGKDALLRAIPFLIAAA